jgi:hypothetical protein
MTYYEIIRHSDGKIHRLEKVTNILPIRECSDGEFCQIYGNKIVAKFEAIPKTEKGDVFFLLKFLKLYTEQFK